MPAKKMPSKTRALSLKKGSRYILLFEDIPAEATPKIADIKAEAKGKIEVIHYQNPPDDSTDHKNFNFEQAVLDVFGTRAAVEEHVALIVADQELSQYDQLRPATGETVDAFAKTLGIPVCFYERDLERGSETLRLQRWQKWSKARIILRNPQKNFGLRCVSLFNGFESIRNALLASTEEQRTPAILLSVILGRREMADRIAQYGANEQGILEEIASLYDEANAENSNKAAIAKVIHKHLPRILGNWLLTSLLRYPGITVDENSCAAYLGLAHQTLTHSKMAKALSSAEYKGPFSKFQTWWWRDKIDELLTSGKDTDTGVRFAKSNGVRPLHELKCTTKGCAQVAKYNCMLSGKVVCADHSRGGISWFPAGADLARVSKIEFEKIGPFIGIY